MDDFFRYFLDETFDSVRVRAFHVCIVKAENNWPYD